MAKSSSHLSPLHPILLRLPVFYASQRSRHLHWGHKAIPGSLQCQATSRWFLILVTKMGHDKMELQAQPLTHVASYSLHIHSPFSNQLSECLPGARHYTEDLGPSTQYTDIPGTCWCGKGWRRHTAATQVNTRLLLQRTQWTNRCS